MAKLSSQALSLTRQQFDTVRRLGLVLPISVPKSQEKGLKTILENANYQAHKIDKDGKYTTPGFAYEIDEVLKNNTNNLIFARFQHPQTDNSIYMSGETGAKWDALKHGLMDMPGMATLDFGSGRRIVLAFDDETEVGFSYSKDEIVAESKAAYMNWKFKDATIDSAEATKIAVKIESGGQMAFDFDSDEMLVVGKEKLICNPEGSERRNVCKCSKVVSDGSYIYDIRVTLYTQDFERMDYQKDANGNLLTDVSTGEYIPVKRIVSKPFMDLVVHGYENAIDYTKRYNFSEEETSILKTITRDGLSLVVDTNDKGTMLHSFQPSYEEEDIEYEKEQMLSLGKDGNGQRIKKGDMKNIITYADLMKFRTEKKLDVV